MDGQCARVAQKRLRALFAKGNRWKGRWDGLGRSWRKGRVLGKLKRDNEWLFDAGGQEDVKRDM